MAYLRPILLVIALFLLTSGLCWLISAVLLLNPLCSAVLLLLGSLGVVMMLDFLEPMLPR